MARSEPASPDADQPTGSEPPAGRPTGEGLTVERAQPFDTKNTGKAAGAGTEHPLPEPPPPPVEVELVEEETVRSGLQLQGQVVHTFFAVDQDDDEWVWLQHELDTIAPPLTRIINRYPVLAAVAARYGDPAIVVGSFAGYAQRSLEERAQAIARRRFLEEQQGSGQADFRFGGPEQ